jgi:hypothetical protein
MWSATALLTSVLLYDQQIGEGAMLRCAVLLAVRCGAYLSNKLLAGRRALRALQRRRWRSAVCREH